MSINRRDKNKQNRQGWTEEAFTSLKVWATLA